MKKVLISALTIAAVTFSGIASANTSTCTLYVYLENNAFMNADRIVFNVVDQDGNKNYTGTVMKATSSVMLNFQMPCDDHYNIYATEITNPKYNAMSGMKINLHGDLEYMGNALTLSGDTSIFYPSRFQSV
ncbi:MAG: hypothetical protein O2809_04620 [Proteobacteria bacterium]|nr:hypothetical protein [Pseudomonadota bacterium]